MRHLPFAVLFTLALPADAQTCGTWSAAVWEVEGGTALTASVCAETGGAYRAVLSLQCGGPGQYALAFDDGASDEFNWDMRTGTRDVVFATEDGNLTVPMIYQDMDGLLFAPVAVAGPLVALLADGLALTVTPAPGGYLPRGFSLSGATAALARLRADCG